MSADSDAATLAHAQAHITTLLAASPIYAHLFNDVRVVSASAAHVEVQLALEARHLNSKASLHGSVTATLVDFIGGVAIACHDGRANTGVSTDIHVSYAGGARAGDTVAVEGRAEKVGGSLAFTRATVWKVAPDGGRGALVATGSHTKFVRAKPS